MLSSPEKSVDIHVTPSASALPSAPTRNWAGAYSPMTPRGCCSVYMNIIQYSPDTCSNSLCEGQVASGRSAVRAALARFVSWPGPTGSSVKLR